MAHTDADPQALERVLQECTGGYSRQRRHGNHVGLGGIQHDRVLSRLSRRPVLHADIAGLRQGDHPPGQGAMGKRPACHRDRAPFCRGRHHPEDGTGRKAAEPVPNHERRTVEGWNIEVLSEISLPTALSNLRNKNDIYRI